MRHHRAIAKASGRVVVETLNVSGMVRNRRLSRAISDAGMSGFLTKLEYQCAWYGAEFVKRTGGTPRRSCALTVAGRTMTCISGTVNGGVAVAER